MRVLHLVRRHPVPATLLVLAVAVLTLIGVRALTPRPLEANLAVNETPESESEILDSRLTVWQPGEFTPDAEPSSQIVPALAPQPNPDAWSRLSSLNVTSASRSEKSERSLDMPAPAGLDNSMTSMERQRWINGSSVENVDLEDRGPVIRLTPTSVCLPPPR